jgi:ACS family hexuronate transporter-like MFS transporter
MSVAWFFVTLTFMPVLLMRGQGFSARDMSLLMALIGLAGGVSAVVVPLLSERFGRRTACIIFAFAGTLIAVPALVSGLGTIAMGAFVFASCLMLGTFPILLATIPQESVAGAGATASAIVLAVSQLIGGLVGPLVAGGLSEWAGARAAIAFAGLLAFLAGLAACGIKETRRFEEVA